MRPVTAGPKHHFFGYYDKSPWNASGRLLLAHEADFNDRPPRDGDQATVGVIDLADGCRFRAFGETSAWNWQQGAMLQWHPDDPENRVVYNERRGEHCYGVVADTAGRKLKVLDDPVYALSPDGRQAFSLNFARLHRHRPGYGYAGLHDRWAEALHSPEDGIRHIDMDSGRARLIVSLAQLASLSPKPEMLGVHHWVNHIQASPGGARIAFFHLWRSGRDGWQVRLYACAPDGTGLSLVLDTGLVSHYDWLDDTRLLVWARTESGPRFLLCDVASGERAVFGEGTLTEDGHASFSPDRQWLLNDTYPDRYGMRTLMLVRWNDGRRFDLARLRSPKERWWGEIRCDLHPRWRRDGRQVCIDSVHSGERQMYVLDVEEMVQ